MREITKEEYYNLRSEYDNSVQMKKLAPPKIIVQVAGVNYDRIISDQNAITPARFAAFHLLSVGEILTTSEKRKMPEPQHIDIYTIYHVIAYNKLQNYKLFLNNNEWKD